MIVDIILSLSFLLLLGLTILNINRVINTEREFRALMYNSDVIQFILSSSMVAFAILSIFIFFFYSWELFLVLLFISYTIEAKIAVPFIENMLGVIIEKIVSRKKKK